ncbi:VCBS repeat-containing protein [Methylobacterium sp. 174MFSha1.1]|uniref:FG-GAP repeat domain-containing protein n=1 Tax=Methylobacterium sp. 174MFSha1.1 TaxID=1502749 RepID=UPI0011609F0E|nr:VCBS repeat-containing protein [Methylobacterium sp. 174MFSha1.1]
MAADRGVSSIRALLAFGTALTGLDHDATHATAVGAAIAAAMQAPAEGVVHDLSRSLQAAYGDGQLSYADAITVILGFSAAATDTLTVQAGQALAGLAGQQPGPSREGGSEGGGEGSSEAGSEGERSPGIVALRSALTAAQDALSGGRLSASRFIALTGGLALGLPDYQHNAQTAMLAAIGSDAGLQHASLAMLAGSANAVDAYNQVGFAVLMKAVADQGSLSLADVIRDIRAAIDAGSLNAGKSVSLMQALINSADAYGYTTGATGTVAAGILAEIAAGLITAVDAMAVIGGMAGLPGLGGGTIVNRLLDILGAATDAAPKVAAARQIAGLVDAVHVAQDIPNPLIQPSWAIGPIDYRAGQGLAGADAALALAAVAARGGTALKAVGDSIRTGVGAGVGIDGLVVGASALGLGTTQTVTILAGVGGSAGFQLLGMNGSYVGDATRRQAAAAAILAAVTAAHATASDLGGAVAAALPVVVVGDSSVFWPEITRVLVEVATVADADAATGAFVGAALQAYVAVGPVPAGTVIGVIDGMAQGGQTLGAARSLDILLGMAAHGDVALQAAIGREIGTLATRNDLVVATGTAAVTDRLAAAALTTEQAVTILAALVGSTRATTIGTAGVDALVRLSASSTAAVTGAIDAAVAATALSLDEALRVLATLAGRSDATIRALLTAEAVSLVSATDAEASVGALLTEAGSGNAALQAAAGGIVAALVEGQRLTGARAVALVDAAIGAGTLTGVRGLALLVAFAVGSGDRAALLQSEIAALIDNRVMPRQAVITALQDMQSGADTGSASVLADSLDILLADPSTLGQTAGLGTSARVQAVARTIASLLDSDRTAADAILDNLAPRIRDGNLTGAQAGRLLLDLIARGGTAETVGIARLVALAMPAQGESRGLVAPGDVAGQVSAMQAAGTLGASTTLAVLTRLIGLDGGAIRAAIADAVGAATAPVTVAQIDAAVTAGRLTVPDAIAVLGVVAKAHGGTLQAAALDEITALATDATSAGAALIGLVGILGAADAAIRSAGAMALSAFLNLRPELADRAFALVVPLAGSATAAIRDDAVGTLAGLVANYGVSATTIRQEVDAELDAGRLDPVQAVSVLVEILGVPRAESDVLDHIVTVATTNHYSQQVPRPGFGAEAAIAAVALRYGADATRMATTTRELSRLEPVTGATGFVSSLGAASTAVQFALLANLLPGFAGDAATSATFTTRMNALLAAMPAVDAADAVANLVTGGTLDPAQAMPLVLPLYATGNPERFLALTAHLPAATVVRGISDLAGSGVLTAHEAVERLAVLGLRGTTSLRAAAAGALATAVVDATPTGTRVVGSLATLRGDGVITAAQSVTLLSTMLLARLDASATLGPTVAAAIDGVIAGGAIGLDAALTAVAGTAAGGASAAIVAVAGEIAALLASRQIAADRVAAAVMAASEGRDPALSPVEAVSLLIAAAGRVDGGLPLEAGRRVAALVTAGTLAAGAGGYAVYTAVVDGWLTAGQGLRTAIGLMAGGSLAAAGEAVRQLLGHGIVSASDLATALGGAVAADTVTATTAVDLAAGLAAAAVDGAQQVVGTLVSSGRIGGADAVVELARFIGTTAITIPADRFMAVLAGTAALAPDAAAALGTGLAEVMAAGGVTPAQAAAGLAAAVDGTDRPPVAPILAFGPAVAIVLGAAADAGTTATGARIAATAGTLLAALTGADGERSGSALAAIGSALADRRLAASAAIQLLAGWAEAGPQGSAAALGQAAANLVRAGLASVYDLRQAVALTAAGSTSAGRAASFLAGAALTLGAAPVTDRQVPAGQLAELIRGGLATASAFDAVAGAAASLGASGARLVTLFSDLALVSSDPSLAVAIGGRLALLVGQGSLALADATAGSPLPVLAGMAEADRLQVSGVTDAARTAIVAAIAAKAASPSSPGMVADALAGLITGGALTAWIGLDLLARVARAGDGALRLAAGGAIRPLLAAGTVTPALIEAAIGTAGLAGAESAPFLASLIDTRTITSATLLSGATSAAAGGFQPGSGRDEFLAALEQAISPQGGPMLLSAAQAIALLAPFGDGNEAGAAITALIARLVAATRVAPAEVYTVLGQTLLALPETARPSELAFMRQVALGLGETPGAFTQAIATAADDGLGADGVLAVLASLTRLDPPRYADASPDRPFVHLGIAAGRAAAGLVETGRITAAQALAGLAATTGLSDDNRALLLLGFADAAGPDGQVAAGRTLAALLDAGATPDLQQELLGPAIGDAALAALLAGTALGATGAAAKSLAGISFAARAQGGGLPAIGRMVAGLGAAQASGALTAVQEVRAIGLVAEAVLVGPSQDPRRPYGNGEALRAALDAELSRMVSSGGLTALATVTGLAGQAGAGTAARQAAAGRLIGTLVAAGAIPAADAIAAIDGSGIAADAQAAIAAGAALAVPALAEPLGRRVGDLVAAGRITAAAALASVQAADIAYGSGDLAAEASLLVAASAQGGAEMGFAAGTGLGRLVVRGLPVASVLASMEAGGLPASGAAALLAGLVATGPEAARVAVGREILALAAAGTMTVAQALQAVHDGVLAGSLAIGPAAGLLVVLAAEAPRTADAVTAEIASLVAGGRVPATGAAAALSGAAGLLDRVPHAPQTDTASAGLIAALIARGMLTAADGAASLGSAVTAGALTGARGFAVALAVAGAQAGAAGAFGAELPALLSGGLAASDVSGQVRSAVAGGVLAASVAITVLAGGVQAVSVGEFVAVTRAAGAGLAALIEAGLVDQADVIASLRPLLVSRALDPAREAGLIAAAVPLLAAGTDTGPLAAELARLVTAGDLTSAALFAVLEGVAGSGLGTATARLVAGMAAGADPALAAAIVGELSGLVGRGLVGEEDVARAIEAAALPAATADLLLVRSLASRPAGAGIARLIAAGRRSAGEAIADVEMAVAAGTLGRDAAVTLYAWVAVAAAGTEPVAALSAQLARLVTTGQATAAQVFADIAAAAGTGAYPEALGRLIGGMAGGGDAALQAAVGVEIGRLVAAGALSPRAALDGVVAGGSALSDAAVAALLALAATGGPALLAGIGRRFGAALPGEAGAAARLTDRLDAAVVSGQVEAGRMATLLAGLATAGLAGGPEAGAVTGEVNGLILSGALAPEAASGFLATIGNAPYREFLAAFVALNGQVLSGTVASSNAALTLQNLIITTATQGFRVGLTRTGLTDAVATLGGLGSDSALMRLAAVATASDAALAEASRAAAALPGSGLLTASRELAGLVADGRIGAPAALAAAAAAAGTLGVEPVAAWLAGLAGVPALAGAAAQGLAALVGAGTLTGTAALALVGDVTNHAAARLGPTATVSSATAATLLLGLAAQGDAALVEGIARQIGGLIATPQGTSSAGQILGLVDAAITGGTLPGTQGLLLLGDILTGDAEGAKAAVQDFLTARLPAYLASGRVGVDAVVPLAFGFVGQAGTIDGGALLAGRLVDLAGGATRAIREVDARLGAGTVTGAQAVASLLGVAAQENASRDATLTTLNSAYDAANRAGQALGPILRQMQDATGAAETAFAAVKTDLLAMVAARAVPGSTVVAALRAAGGLSTAQSFALLVALGRDADAATQTSVAEALAGMGTRWGPASDPFFTGGLAHAAQDVLAVIDGRMSVAGAIADVESDARTRRVSTDAGLTLLGSLLTQYDGGSTSRSFAVTAELARRVAIGETAGELARRVAEGTTPFVDDRGRTRVPADPTALSLDDARVLLRSAVGQYGGSFTVADASFASGVSVAQIGRSEAFNSFAFKGHVLDALRASSFVGLTRDEVKAINASYTAGYAYDQALAVLADQLATSPSPRAAANADETRGLLVRRLMAGTAETDIVNLVANESLTPDQAITALDRLLAPALVGASAEVATLTRQTALGWLAIKSAQFVEGNYQLTRDADGKQVQTYLPNQVNALYSQLAGAMRNDVLTGLGAIGSIQNDAFVGATDRVTAFKVVQTILGDIAARGIQASSGGALLTSEAAVQKAMADISFDVSSAAAFFDSGWTSIQSVAQAAPPSSWSAGKVYSDIAARPTDYRTYIDIGANIVTRGLPIPVLGDKIGEGLKLPKLTDVVWNEVLGEGAGQTVARVGLASKVALTILSINAVSHALGPVAPALTGVFTVTNATSDLLGNVLSGVVKTAARTYASAAINIGQSFGNLGAGNFDGLKASAGDVAKDLFTLSSGGFSPESLGAVGSDAGAALVDLASGRPSDAGRAARALGEDVLKALTTNVYFASAKDAILTYGETMARELFSAAHAAVKFFDNLIHNPRIHASPPQTMVRDLASMAAKGLKDPSSTSNYGDFYHGRAVDGYLGGATAFVDGNGNGVLDPGEYSTTTDASGAYALPDGLTGPIVLTGGTDGATGLPFTGTLAAPAGSAAVTPLTTLVQTISAGSGESVASATARVNAAFGLPAETDHTRTDPLAATKAGTAGGAALFVANAAVLNTLTLLRGAGATGDVTGALARAITALPAGTALDLAAADTVSSVAAAAGVPPAAAAAAAQIASASNTLLAQKTATLSDPADLLSVATAVSIATQGAASQALAGAGGDAAGLVGALAAFTGSGLDRSVAGALTRVGSFAGSSAYPVVRRDFDGDGRDDVMWRFADPADADNSLNGAAQLWFMDGLTVDRQGRPSTSGAPAGWNPAGFGDVNGDGRTDVVWQYRNAQDPQDPRNGSTYLWEMNGSQVVAEGPVDTPRDPGWTIAATGDFDGDGKSDLLLRFADPARPADARTGQTMIVTMDGLATKPESSGLTSVQVTDTNWRIVGSGDFNGDGKADIVWQYGNAANGADPLNGATDIWTMTGTTVLSEGVTSLVAGTDRWGVAGIGDFNGDGIADLLFRYHNAADAADLLNGMLYDFTMGGRNGNNVVSAAPLARQVDESWDVATVADLNGDGRTDLLFRNKSSAAAPIGATYEWIMNGTQVMDEGLSTAQTYGESWTVIR